MRHHEPQQMWRARADVRRRARVIPSQAMSAVRQNRSEHAEHAAYQSATCVLPEALLLARHHALKLLTELYIGA